MPSLRSPVLAGGAFLLSPHGVVVCRWSAIIGQGKGQSAEALTEGITRAERKVKGVQAEEDRAIRLYVSGKITETQLDRQRKFITERLETVRAELDSLKAQ